MSTPRDHARRRRPLAALLAAGLATGLAAGAMATEPGSRHIAEFTGDMPAWLPEADFAPGVQDEPFMLIYEVTRFPYAHTPDPEQRAAARRLVEATGEAAEANGWFDFERAVADGYELMFRDTVHYAHRGHVTDGRTLDPERPEFLMYYDTEEGRRLTGVMYLVSEPDAEGPQIGGPATVWHYHVWAETQCLLDGLLLVGEADADGRCAEGVPGHRSPEMMHVWLLDHPDGPFATDMFLPPWAMEQLDHHHRH